MVGSSSSGISARPGAGVKLPFSDEGPSPVVSRKKRMLSPRHSRKMRAPTVTVVNKSCQAVFTKQLDLFGGSAPSVEPDISEGETRPVTAWDLLDDDSLVAAVPAAGIRNILAWTAEVGRRRLSAAVPVLEALCRRYAGFGVDQIVPEQASALDALSQIGGAEARRAIAPLISRKIVLGPSLQKALAAAVCLRASLPADAVLDLLRHNDPQIRADGCRFVRAWPDTIPLLLELLDDFNPDVRMAAACALGRLGRSEV